MRGHGHGSTSRLPDDKTWGVLAVTLYFVCGVAAGRALAAPLRVSGLLNNWVVKVALPSLILAKLPALALGSEAAVPVLTAWLTVSVAALTVVAVSRWRSWSVAVTGALLMVVPLGNTSFLGLPVVEAILGDDHVPAALAFDQIGTFLALATYGSLVAGRFGAGERGIGPMARRLVTFPPFLALVASMFLRLGSTPGWLHDVFASVGRTVAPVAIVSLGLRFTPRLHIEKAGIVLFGLGVKMLFLPAVVLGAALLVGDPGAVAWQSSLLESAMPPMVTAGIIGISAGFDEELTTTLVAVGTTAALVVLPVVSFVVG